MITAMKQALDALLFAYHEDEAHPKTKDAITSLRQAIAEAEKQEPIELPAPVFKTVADGIEIGHDLLGGASIRLGGEFVYVHINYDHRYTYNSARDKLAEAIVKLLTGTPQRQWVGLTDEERMAIPPMYSNGGQLAYAEAIEAKLKEKNT